VEGGGLRVEGGGLRVETQYIHAYIHTYIHTYILFMGNAQIGHTDNRRAEVAQDRWYVRQPAPPLQTSPANITRHVCQPAFTWLQIFD